MQAPLLIALPSGLVTSGVVTWATRLANALARRGRLAGLILHAPTPGHARLECELDPRVRVFDVASLPPLEHVNGDLSAFIPHYRDAIHDLAIASGSSVVVSPNLLGDCYGIAAGIALSQPEVLRVLGWAHLDSPYEYAMLAHYDPLLAGIVGVSAAVDARLRHDLPARGAEIRRIAYGVPPPPARPAPASHGPLRLIYAGRMEQDVKRVGALVHLSDELSRRGVPHRLTLLGDGPAAGEIDAQLRARSVIHRIPAVPAARVPEFLAQHDVFVQASRIEGLSLSILEAMSCGCVPVVTRTRSGADEAIEDGVTGRIVDWEDPAHPAPDAMRLGRLLADGVCDAVHRGLSTMSAGAASAARSRYSMEAHVDAVERLTDEAAQSPPRAWPAHRPCAFTGLGGAGSGTVPANAAERLRAILGQLAGRKVVLHGTGRHTLELAGVLAEFTPSLAGFTDDDPAKHGRKLWGLPILAPTDARLSGATDVVISSALHQTDIWSRRGIYEAQGLSVHRLYPAAA